MVLPGEKLAELIANRAHGWTVSAAADGKDERGRGVRPLSIARYFRA